MGLFMEAVCRALHELHPDKLHHEFKVLPGKAFATDEAIVGLAVIRQERKKVIFALEYKPNVASELMDQPPFHISEMVLQALYLTTHSDHEIVHCLTDLQDYHIFVIRRAHSHCKVQRTISAYNILV